MQSPNNYTLESTRFLSRELISGGNSYYANFHILLTEDEMNGKALPKTKTYVKEWYPTTCDEKMKDVLIDVYPDQTQNISCENGIYTIYWNPCAINVNEITHGDAAKDPFTTLSEDYKEATKVLTELNRRYKLADKFVVKNKDEYEDEVIEGEEEGDERKEESPKPTKSGKNSKKKTKKVSPKPTKSGKKTEERVVIIDWETGKSREESKTREDIVSQEDEDEEVDD